MKHLVQFSCIVFSTFSLSLCAQIRLDKLKDKAAQAVSNAGTQNNTPVENSGGATIYKGTDPFNGSGNTIVTLAGSGSMNEFGFKDEKGRDALFDHPEGLATDENGNVYVADKLNNRIRKISPAGEVSTFAGSGERDSKNGIGKEAALDQPFYIWYDGSKNFYAIEENNTVRKISKEGKVSTVYRQKNYPGYVDGEIGDANFDGIKAVVSNSKGDIFFLDSKNNCIRKLSGGTVSTYAGNKNARLTYESQIKDGPGAKATFWDLKFMVIDKADNLFVSDASQRIRKIDAEGNVSTLPFEELITNTKSTYRIDDGNSHGVRDVGVFTELALLSNGNFLISTEGGEIHEVSADVKAIKFVYTGTDCNSHKDSDFRSVSEVKDGEDCKGCVGSDKAKKLGVTKDGK
ncbi:MAG: repeat containing protein, partial [Bacteroidetes bacterium]|nr:repeat containing protein [Bacteroidota bacterium]